MTENIQGKARRDSVVSGPILKTVISLAWPVTAGMIMEVTLQVVDFYWVGDLGPSAQDAITSSMVLIWTFFSIVTLVTIGTTALVSRNVGAEDWTKAAHFVRQSMWMALFMGIFCTAAGMFFVRDLLKFMAAGPETLAHAIPYLRVFFISTTLFALAETMYAIFRASGNTRTPMRIGITVVVINMILDPILIFGWGPIPAYGVTGASYATLIAICIGIVEVFRQFKREAHGFTVEALYRRAPKLKSFLKIARIGLPIALQQFVFVAVYWFLIKYVHAFGEEAGAAMGIGNRMESISYLVCLGFSMAASTMVGQNLGAKKPDRAERCAWSATGLGIGFTLILSFLFIFIPDTIASIFTDDPKVMAIAHDYLIILGLSQMTMATEIVLEGAFSGSGDTLPPMFVMIPGSVIRIPLAWYLTFELDWGINGIWWTMTISTTLKALILAWWFKLGRWKTREV